MTAELIRPAYLWVPEHAVSSAAEEVISFGEQIGMVPDAEQRLVLDALLAEAESGDWAAFENALVCARQNLKTWCFRLIVLAGMFVFKTKLTVWTAHQVSVTVEAHRDIKETVEAYPHLTRRVKKTMENNQERGFELFDGVRLLFKARTKTGGRGLTAPRIVLDEAQELTPEMMGSFMPTMRAIPNPHLLYGGSAGKEFAETWRSVRDRGRAGSDPGLSYVEWSAPVVDCKSARCDHKPFSPGCAMDNHEAWLLANPAMRSGRIRISHMEKERRSMKPEVFALELLSWWEEPGAGKNAALDATLWDNAKILEKSDISDTLAVAIDVTPDSTHAAVVVAFNHDGSPAVQVLRNDAGTSWVASFVADLGVSHVWLDTNGPASVLVKDDDDEVPVLKGAEHVHVLAVTGADMTKACAGLVDALQAEAVLHVADEDLDAAVAGAVRAGAGDSWKWSRKSSSINIAPLVAATVALHGAGQPAPEPATAEFIVL